MNKTIAMAEIRAAKSFISRKGVDIKAVDFIKYCKINQVGFRQALIDLLKQKENIDNEQQETEGGEDREAQEAEYQPSGDTIGSND